MNIVRLVPYLIAGLVLGISSKTSRDARPLAPGDRPRLDHALRFHPGVADPSDESERYFLLGPAGLRCLPTTIDHCGELLIWREPLPLEARVPVLEETPRSALALAAPQLVPMLDRRCDLI